MTNTEKQQISMTIFQGNLIIYCASDHVFAAIGHCATGECFFHVLSMGYGLSLFYCFYAVVEELVFAF